MSKVALVVMAAGMASRYGGEKQVEGMGPHGEILLEYSIHDAMRAGFDKVVFIIKPGMAEKMREICGNRLEKSIEVRYAEQDFSSIPAFYPVPKERVKPFGTVHAVLCAQEYLSEPFAVINADDYYGVESFQQMFDFLNSNAADGSAAMMGYRLKNTVSKNGSVTRGLCAIQNGMLTGVREVKKIRQSEDGGIFEEADAEKRLDPESPVSMNFWGFAPSIFRDMRAYFENFLKHIPEGNLTAECLLPEMVDSLIHSGALRVRVLETEAVWFGVTYRADRENVVRALKKLHDEGVY